MNHTSTCTNCNKTFEKPTQVSADQALRLHTVRSHPHAPKAPLRETPTVAVFKPKEPKTVIRWDETEIELLVDTSAAIRLTHPLDSLLDCVRAAIEQLPADRQRHIIAWSTLPPGFQQKVLLRLDTKRKAQIPPPEQTIQTLTIEVPVEKPVTQSAAELPTPVLLAELFGRVIHRLDRLEHAFAQGRHLNGHTNGQHPIAVHHSPSEQVQMPVMVSRAAPRKPRIAIAGLLKDQYEHAVTKLAHTHVEYVFIDKDKDKNDTTIPNVDAVIIGRHANHRWSTNARAELGHGRVFFADGISTVVQRALDFLSRQPKAHA